MALARRVSAKGCCRSIVCACSYLILPLDRRGLRWARLSAISRTISSFLAPIHAQLPHGVALTFNIHLLNTHNFYTTVPPPAMPSKHHQILSYRHIHNKKSTTKEKHSMKRKTHAFIQHRKRFAALEIFIFS